jgi:hypothetical protein
MNRQISPRRKALSRDPAGADSDGIVIPGATLTRGRFSDEVDHGARALFGCALNKAAPFPRPDQNTKR